jgi:hypothetical protein
MEMEPDHDSIEREFEMNNVPVVQILESDGDLLQNAITSFHDGVPPL